MAAFQQVLSYLHFADSTITDVQNKTTAKFLVGASSYYIVNVLAQGLAASKSCDEAKLAQTTIVDATIYTQQGGRAFRENAAAILGGLNQLSPYVDAQVKAFCK